ncbi:outer membrane beta-barrel protein [Alteromonas sp. 1_MG-2023]|uniref:outer membrane beta-barrel protein n=1 Tax=Alteromonas sp. 1_MG-2023 TaxID=3062669 RepID=UPI0026E3BFA4|nr:outer membrane beta-barrel protein [Alteromonas sp. 1_MG-2023]MDO6475425.1 outer membrane beta-barrel protein [Alteromonas sp. 1_MG-2023]
MRLKVSFIIICLSPFYVKGQSTDVGLNFSADGKFTTDDNIYRVTEDIAKNDTFISLNPKVTADTIIGKHSAKLTYAGDFAKYSKEEMANYNDHDLDLKINFDHSYRLTTKIEGGYKKEHEDPGAFNRIQLDISEYNRYVEKFYLIGMKYGAESAIGQLSFNYQNSEKDYKNNGLDYLDFNKDQFTGRFTYRVAPKTEIYLEAQFAKFDYKPASNFELDNDYKRYRAGVSWEFTNKLEGDVNLGYQDRDYLQPTLRDINGLAYDGRLTWHISSYTDASIAAKRESIDSSLEGVGGFLRTSFGTSLEHSFTELIHLNFDLGYSTDEVIHEINREDKRYRADLSLNYDLTTRVSTEIGYRLEKRESTDSLADFTANIFEISISGTLK